MFEVQITDKKYRYADEDREQNMLSVFLLLSIYSYAPSVICTSSVPIATLCVHENFSQNLIYS